MRGKVDTQRAAIRFARNDDRAFLSRLSAASFAEYSDRPSGNMARMLEDGVVLIAEHAWAGKATPTRLGFAVVDVSAPVRSSTFEAPRLAYLSAIAVIREAKGCGIGRELLDAAEDYARSHGAVAMSLHTATTNHAAHRLFKRAGYSPILAHEGFYRANLDAVRMQKSLSLART